MTTNVGISDNELESRLRSVLNAVDPVRTPTRAEVDAMFDRHDAGRAVVAAAREWRRASSNGSDAEWSAAGSALGAAVDRLEALSVGREISRDATPGPLCRSLSDDRPEIAEPCRVGPQATTGGE